MNKNLTKLCVLAAAGCIAASSQADWVQWSGNGHWYQVFAIEGADYSWTTARTQAQTLVSSSDLATITSSGENEFIHDLVNDPAFWANDAASNSEGPYIGGFQDTSQGEPNGGWQWVTGEAWSYTNWNSGEPNNFGGSENFLTLFGPGLNNRAAVWNDVGNSSDSIIHYYVAEADAVPEPATMLAMATGGLLFLRRRRA